LLLARAHDVNAVHGAWIEQYDATNPARWHVVKIHEPDEALLWRAKVTLTSRRDLRDIAASAWRRGWISDECSTLVFLDSVVKQHAFWKARCAYEMVYERMQADRPLELARIARVLDLKLSDDEIQRVSTEIDTLGFDDSREDAFDPSTLLHKRHIMDGRVGSHTETLPQQLIDAINERYAEWLRANGYACA
jgi:hypothetical protein